MLSTTNLLRVARAAAKVPIVSEARVDDNLGTCLVTTVVDFQMHVTVVSRALARFENDPAHRASTLGEFERYPNTRRGNEKLAQDLLGYAMWTRVGLLRALVQFLRDEGVGDLTALRAWADRSDFRQDFQGRVQYTAEGRTFGLGPAVYSWLVMRLGIETLKPDERLHRFVETAIGHRASDSDAASAIAAAAAGLGVSPRQLHWSICQEMRE
jgi:hypothetical protein